MPSLPGLQKILNLVPLLLSYLSVDPWVFFEIEEILFFYTFSSEYHCPYKK